MHNVRCQKKNLLSLSLSLNLCKFKKKYWLNFLRTPHHVVTLDKFIYIYMQSLFDVNVEPFCIFTNTFTESTHTWNHWWFEMCATFFFYLYLIRPFIVYNYIFGINNKFNGISYFFLSYCDVFLRRIIVEWQNVFISNQSIHIVNNLHFTHE